MIAQITTYIDARGLTPPVLIELEMHTTEN